MCYNRRGATHGNHVGHTFLVKEAFWSMLSLDLFRFRYESFLIACCEVNQFPAIFYARSLAILLREFFFIFFIYYGITRIKIFFFISFVLQFPLAVQKQARQVDWTVCLFQPHLGLSRASPSLPSAKITFPPMRTKRPYIYIPKIFKIH